VTRDSRRQRHVAEIRALAAAGRHDRARDLVLVHLAEFPDDADLLAELVRPRTER
jgi:hypothetical protein